MSASMSWNAGLTAVVYDRTWTQPVPQRGGGLVHARHSSDAVAVATRRRWDHNITTFAIAEGPRDALLSRNLANYESSL